MGKTNLKENRRHFIKSLIPVGGMLCIGCPSLFNACTVENKQEMFSKNIHKEFSITSDQYFRDKYNYYIGLMKKFIQYMDKESLIRMIKKATDENNQSIKPNMQVKSVKVFANSLLENKIYKTCLDLETLELTDNVFELKVTNCLWAKTFRDKDSADIGYATICHGDFSSAAAYHPKLKLERTKTLMEGHDCCNFKFIWKD